MLLYICKSLLSCAHADCWSLEGRANQQHCFFRQAAGVPDRLIDLIRLYGICAHVQTDIELGECNAALRLHGHDSRQRTDCIAPLVSLTQIEYSTGVLARSRYAPKTIQLPPTALKMA